MTAPGPGPGSPMRVALLSRGLRVVQWALAASSVLASCNCGSSDRHAMQDSGGDAGCASRALSCAAMARASAAVELPSTGVAFGRKWNRSFGGSVSSPIYLSKSKKLAFTTGHEVRIVEAVDGSGETALGSVGDEQFSPNVSADDQDNIYYAGDSIYSATPAGGLRWTAHVGTHALRPIAVNVVVSDDALYVVSSDNRLSRLTQPEGRFAWSVDAEFDQFHTVTGRIDTLFVPEPKGYAAFDSASGQLRWSRADCSSVVTASPPVLTEAGVFIAELDPQPTGVSPSSGFELDACGRQLAMLQGSGFSTLLEDVAGHAVAVRPSGGGQRC